MSLTDQAAPDNATENDQRGAPSSYSSSGKGGQQQPRMVRLTVSLPGDLVDCLRDAVYWSPSLTLAWLIAHSLRTTLREMEALRQGPFPKRTHPLRPGRPRLVGQTTSLFSRGRHTPYGTASATQEDTQVTPISPLSIE